MSGGQCAKQPGRFAQWFYPEGCLKQAEFLNDAYDDVNLSRVLSIHNNPASGVRVMRSSR